MTALRDRDATGRGQVVDLAIIEPILAMMGGAITAYDQTGYLQPRTGNRSANNAPRNVYQTADGDWLAVSSSSQSIAERIMTLVGRPDLITQPWFATGRGRAEHVEEVDRPVAAWIRARTTAEVLDAFEQAHAAVAPVYDAAGVIADPQYRALGTVATVPDEDLGPLKMQNVLFRLSASPGSIRWTGRGHGADTDAVLSEIGLNADQVAGLRRDGVL
jgi:crotonobetainyl-CoA:carnitine CoA-transferase CaiB-like acyl-CoA transferase